MAKSKIVLVTSGQPSLNPRLIKEADALADAGYDVTVLYSYWNDWGTKFDKILIPAKKWKAICVGGDPVEKKLTYFFSRVIHKIAKIVNQNTRGKYLGELAIARSSYFLRREAKKHRADLYIGHNLGAISATVKAAHVNKKPSGFDAEDFHRYETSDDQANPDVILKAYLEDRYLPHINYLTASSPLIAEAYQKLFPDKKPVVILNVFPQNLNIQQPEINNDKPIKLFWFSQTIGPGRGIEDVIKALSILKEQSFELHLLGNCSAEAKSELTNKESVNIYFHEPIPPDEVISFASRFDIGLAVENNVPLNRDICLTNKIFTYIQAGLAVVASDTTAQQQLINDYPGIGNAYQNGDTKSLANALLYYNQHRRELFETRKVSLALGMEKLNWETEQQKFLAVVENSLSNF